MRGIKADFEKLGKLVIVGQGNLAQAQDFDKTHGDGLFALVDTHRAAYKALGFVRSRLAILDPRSTAKGLEKATRGFMQGTVQGDAFQMGGTLVIAKGGAPTFFYRSAYPGDHPDAEDVLRELEKASAASRRK